MINAEYLLDGFKKSGKSESEFEELIKEIDSHTTYKIISKHDIAVFSLLDEMYQTEVPRKCIGRFFEAGNPWVKDKNSTAKIAIVSLDKIIPRNIDMPSENLYHKLMTSNTRMFYVNDEKTKGYYYVSEHALTTLAQRLGVTLAAISPRSFATDVLIAQLLDREQEMKLVIKNYKNVKKIFATLSPKYVEIPLYDICVIYRDLLGENPEVSKIKDKSPVQKDQENVHCEGWEIAHERVRISFSFSGYADDLKEQYKLEDKLIPCIELTNSDIGESAFTALGYWITEEGAKIHDLMYKREHRIRNKVTDAVGNYDTLNEEIQKGIKHEIFDRYHELPERLLELKKIEITSSDIDPREGHNIILNVYQQIFKQLQITKVISYKRKKWIMEKIEHEHIKINHKYTAYDIVMDIYNMEKTLRSKLEDDGVCKETIRKFFEAIGKAAYVDFDKILK